MEKSRYTEEQIIGILKQHEGGEDGEPVPGSTRSARRHCYGWKLKFGGMDVSEAAGAGGEPKAGVPAI